MTRQDPISLQIRCASSGHYDPRINDLMAIVGGDMGDDVHLFSLQIEITGDRQIPTLQDCKIVTSRGPGQITGEPLGALSPDARDAAAALAFRFAGEGGLIDDLARNSMTRPTFQFMPQGVLAYDADNLPPSQLTFARINFFTKNTFAYQGGTGAHQRQLFTAEVSRLMETLISPPDDLGLSFILRRNPAQGY